MSEQATDRFRRKKRVSRKDPFDKVHERDGVSVFNYTLKKVKKDVR